MSAAAAVHFSAPSQACCLSTRQYVVECSLTGAFTCPVNQTHVTSCVISCLKLSERIQWIHRRSHQDRIQTAIEIIIIRLELL